MTDNSQRHTDAPDIIRSNPSQALHELFNLQQTNPSEFKRERDFINQNTDVSFLAGGREDMKIVGFEHEGPNRDRLIMGSARDGSTMRTNHTAEDNLRPDAYNVNAAPRTDGSFGYGRPGHVTPQVDASAYQPGNGSPDANYQRAQYAQNGDQQAPYRGDQQSQYRGDQPGQYRDQNSSEVPYGGLPVGSVHHTPTSLDLDYPGGRHIHVGLDGHNPINFTEGGHTYDRQGDPSQHRWVDRQTGQSLFMEMSFDQPRGSNSLSLRQADASGRPLGTTIFNMDGSKLDIRGDLQNGQRTDIGTITTPDGRKIRPDAYNGQHTNVMQGFTDEHNVHWVNRGGVFSAQGHNDRNDVRAMPGGQISVFEAASNGQTLATYSPDGTVNYSRGPRNGR